MSPELKITRVTSTNNNLEVSLGVEEENLVITDGITADGGETETGIMVAESAKGIGRTRTVEEEIETTKRRRTKSRTSDPITPRSKRTSANRGNG